MRPLAPGDTETVRLIKQVRALGNARWARDYLAAARFLIDRLGLDPDDRRVNTSLPRRSAKWLLPITINHRYVLVAVRMGDERVAAAVWPAEFDKIPHIRRLAARAWRFDALRGEGALDPPWLVGFRDPWILLENHDLREGWLDAARCELERASASPYRRHHSDTAFQFLADGAMQDRVLANVFGAESR